MNKRELYDEWYGELRASYREQKEAYLALSKDMSLQQIIETIVNGNNDMIFNFIHHEKIIKIGNNYKYSAPLYKRQDIDGQLAIVVLKFFKQYQYDPYRVCFKSKSTRIKTHWCE